MNSPLEPIWQSYQVTCDCLKIAQQNIERENLEFIQKTSFNYASKNEAKTWIQSSRMGSDHYVILSLWAVFERKLYEYIQTQGLYFSSRELTKIQRKIKQKIEKEMEYWRAIDVLDLLKECVGADLIGQAKQVKQYRDWIAHRNESKGAPTNVPPQSAYTILSEILEILSVE